MQTLWYAVINLLWEYFNPSFVYTLDWQNTLIQMLHLILIATLSTTVSFNTSHCISRCQCDPNVTYSQATEAADVIFSGTVQSIKDDINIGSIINDSYWVSIRVDDRWKGNIEQEVWIKTGKDDSTCGFPFHLDKEYILYGYQSDRQGVLYTDNCTPTKLLKNAAGDIVFLDDAFDEPSSSSCGGPTNVAMLQALFFSFIAFTFSNTRKRLS